MSKLHEILAVEAGLKTTAENIIKEAIATFDKKQSHFDGHTKTYKARDEADTEVMNDDIKVVVTTVPAKLEYIQDAIIRLLDCIAQKEVTNTTAKADIILENGEVLAQDVPATLLLQLETYVKRIRDVYFAALTLDPSKQWSPSATDSFVYFTEPVKTARSNKIATPLVLFTATDKHPAQVQLIQKDVQVGDWTTVYLSGAITPKLKSQYLTKIDALERAIKQARQRANTEEVKNFNIGKKLFSFIVE